MTNYSTHSNPGLWFRWMVAVVSASWNRQIKNVTVRLLLVKERVVSGFNALKAVILMSKIGIAVEKRKFSKVPNLRHYLLKSRAKRKENWQYHWEWLNEPFQDASKPWEWFGNKKIGFRTSWVPEMLNGVSLLVNICFKDRTGRCFTSHCERRRKIGPLQ